ncbi:MAG: glycosyltransferase [Candidatus Saccharibacteria bacterium]
MSNKPIRVLHFSSHDENCGVGKYQENYLVGMAKMPDVQNKFFDSSPYKTRIMSPEELDSTIAQMEKELHDYDILHIQHEFGLFSNAEFRKMVEMAKRINKRVVVTVHTSPGFALKPVKLGGLGPRSFLRYARDKRNYAIFWRNHIDTFLQADLLIAHNNATVQSLETAGVPSARIKKLIHPVYEVPAPKPSHEITKALNKQKGDVIFCTTGFIHRYKGMFEAVKALKYLPENYKLAVIGGMHPTSDEVTMYDKLTDLVNTLGLRDRVYITGFVPDDDRLNALIRECDVCIYPYDKVYYANVSSGSLNLAFANDISAIAYPTESFKEIAEIADGALVLTDTFAYYELARELQRIDLSKQRTLSKQYAKKMAWPKMAKALVEAYKDIV